MINTYIHLHLSKIGFVFSNSFSQYASRSTQYEINWLCFFKHTLSNLLSALSFRTRCGIHNYLTKTGFPLPAFAGTSFTGMTKPWRNTHYAERRTLNDKIGFVFHQPKPSKIIKMPINLCRYLLNAILSISTLGLFFQTGFYTDRIYTD